MYRNEVRGFIDSHREEVIEDVCALCRINSEEMLHVEGKSYGEGPLQALQAVPGMAEGYGLSTRNYDNYVGIADLNGRERRLGTLTHLDVVPAGEGWTETESLEPVVKDGKLFERDTADNKRPAVAALCAMRAVEGLGTPLNKNVRLTLGTDEGCEGFDIVNYYDKEDKAPMTFSLDVEFPVVNIGKGRLEGYFYASFQASEATPRLVKVEVGIKANVIPGKARAAVEDIDFKILEATAEVVEKKTGISFALEGGLPVIAVTAQGEDVYASTPQEEKNVLTGLLVRLTRLPFAECPQMGMVKSLLRLFSYGDIYGKAVGAGMEDKLSGALTLAFSILTVGADGLRGVFSSRCPVCATEESALGAVKQTMADQGLTLENDFMMPPHHVDGDSHFVRTLLSVYEDYAGLEGSCQATKGGTYVHPLKNDVAHGAALPGTDNCMCGTDESVVVGELVLNAEMFAQVVVELCS